MDEDMIQLRLVQERLVGEIAALHQARVEDQRTTRANHDQNRTSIHDINKAMQTMTETIWLIGGKIDDYLLVQKTKDDEKAKAWWKQPLGTAVIVAAITVAWAAIQHGMGWR